MSRLTSSSALAITIALTGTVYAQSQAEIAAKLNEEGKELMFGNKSSDPAVFAEAAKKFQEAVARVPEPKYFLNLCLARLQQGKFDEALTACNAVELNNPTEEVKAKAQKLIGKIKEQAKAQNLELHPGGGGGGDPGVDPGHTDPRPTDPNPHHANDPSQPPQPPRYTPTVGRPPAENLALGAAPDNHYTWTLGIDLFAGGGQVGQKDVYGNTTGGFRIKGDYLLNPAARFGAQGYIQVNHLDKGNDQMSTLVSSLDIVDVGVALYKHVCLGGTPRLCITPLAGGHLSLMSPANDSDGAGSQVFNYAAVGARFEVAATYAFGYRYEHAVSLLAGLNVYSPVLSGPSDNVSSLGTAAEVGLDQAGAVGYFGLGYTYRFNTP
ncbi:MAG TPA: hypothetical protein VHN14_20145, partial [Kofleriaceae bacterium]|nr:hypothetical protein [Kofleriaceae bacterium]